MKRTCLFFIIVVSCIGIIHSQNITVTSPNGGETWYISDTESITWTSTGVTGNVIIQLLKRGRSLGAIYNGSNTGSFNWTINTLLNGTTILPGSYRIQVKSSNDTSIKDQSDADFTLALRLRETPSALSKLKPKSDYSVESLTFEDASGTPLRRYKGDYLLNYNGAETRATAIVGLRWNNVPPENPASTRCEPFVRGDVRYLSQRPPRPVSAGSFILSFNSDGVCEQRIPLVIRDGERIGAKVNVTALLLPMARGCDHKSGNNSKAFNIQLGQRLLSSIGGKIQCNLKIAASKTEFKLIRIYKLQPGLPADYEFYRAEFKIHVKNLYRVPRGVTPAPLQNVECKASVEVLHPNGRWYTTPGRRVTLSSVPFGVDVTRNMSERFGTRAEHKSRSRRLRLEVDFNRNFQDTDRSDNVFYLYFTL